MTSGKNSKETGTSYRMYVLRRMVEKRLEVHGSIRVAQSEFLKILRFRVVAEKVHSAQPKRFTRRARNTASLKSGGGGGAVAELSTKI